MVVSACKINVPQRYMLRTVGKDMQWVCDASRITVDSCSMGLLPTPLSMAIPLSARVLDHESSTLPAGYALDYHH
jgi:hypothetical protein